MIRLLPPEVRSCLRSGIATPSIAQCVEELVLNSVDAGATCIAIRVDIPNFRIQVVDNGRGLSKEELDLVGQRYATSKCHQLADLEQLECFGYRGEALASISDISRILEIVSRAKETDVTLSKLFRAGKSEVFEASRQRPSIGTTVTVHGVFHNMPVRRKMITFSLDYERVCRRIEGLALIHPSVSFSLRDDSTRTRSIQTHITSSLINTFRFLFGQTKAKCMKEVTHQDGTFSISGYIGVEGHPNKNLQFIYVNNRLVLKTKLHKAINYLLRKSLIVHYRSRFWDRKNTPEATGMSVTDLTSSPGRPADLYGIFVLNIKCPLSAYDICLEPSKRLVEFRDWGRVLQCVEQLVNRFLARENLAVKIDKEKSQESNPCDNCGLLTLDDGSSQEDEEVLVDGRLTEDGQEGIGLGTRLSQKYGRGINAASCSSTLQSLTVRRPLRKQSSPICISTSPNVSSCSSMKSISSEMLEAISNALTEDKTVSPHLDACIKPTDMTECPGRECTTKYEKPVDSGTQESSDNREEIDENFKVRDDLTKISRKPSTELTSRCGEKREGSAQIVSQSPAGTNGLLVEAASGFEEEFPNIFSPSSAVPSESNDKTTETDSEETDDAVSIFFSLSEMEDYATNPVSSHQAESSLSPHQKDKEKTHIPAMDGLDVNTSECRPPSCIPNDASLSQLDDDHDTSCTAGCMSADSREIHNMAASITQKDSAYEEIVSASELGQKEDHTSGSELVERYTSSPDENSLVCGSQHVANDGENSQSAEYQNQTVNSHVSVPSVKIDTESKCSSFDKSAEQGNDKTIDVDNLQENLQENISNSSSTSEQKTQTNEESDDPFVTPKVRIPDFLQNPNGENAKKHKSSSESSNLSLETSTFDSEGESNTSDSCLLIEQDEISAAIPTMPSSNIAAKESVLIPSKVRHMDSKDNAIHHFIALQPFKVDNTQRIENATISTSPSDCLNMSTSSLQIFKRSIKAEPTGDRSVKHSISELLHGKDVQTTRRYPLGNSREQGKSTHFTTTSPVVLRRRFLPCLMMLGKHTANQTSIKDKQMTGQTSVPEVKNIDVIQSSVSADKNKCDDNKKRGLSTDLLNSPRNNEASSPSLGSKVITTIHAKDGESIQHRERNSAEHTSSAHRPNLKRLREIQVGPRMKSKDVDTLLLNTRATDNKNPIHERKTEEREAPVKKRFMTSDSFLQTFQEVLQPVGNIAMRIEQGTSTDIKTLQAVPCILQDRPSLVVNKHEVTKQCGEANCVSIAVPVSDSRSAIKLHGQNNITSTSCEKAHVDSKVSECRIQSQVEYGTRSVMSKTFQENGQEGNHEQQVEQFWRETGLYPDKVIHPRSQESASPNSLHSHSCNKISDGLPEGDNLPVSVILCDTNFNLRKEQLSSSANPYLRCAISPSHPAVDPVKVCSELSEVRDIGCVINLDSDDLLYTAELENTATSNCNLESSYFATAISPELLSKPHVRETGLASHEQDKMEVETQSEADIIVGKHLDIRSPSNSASRSFTEEGFDESELLPISRNQSEQDIQQVSEQTSSDTDHRDHQQRTKSETTKENSTESQPTVSDQSWAIRYDPKHKQPVYINLKTGNSSLVIPVTEKEGPLGDGSREGEGTSIKDGHALIIPTGRKKSYLHRVHSQCAEPFLSKSTEISDVSCSDLSPTSHSALIDMVDEHIDHQGGDVASKWREDCPNMQTEIGVTMDQLFANWTNPIFAPLEANILNAKSSQMPHNSIRAQTTVHPYKFTKAMFQDIKVLGQLDNKFIACMVNTNDKNKAAEPNLILLIDQHAAHERVRLEQLTADIFEDPSSDEDDDDDNTVEQLQMKSSSIIPPVPMTFSHQQLRLLRAFSNKLERLGVAYHILGEDDDEGKEEGRVEITRLPACLMEREAAELRRGRKPVAVSMVETLLMEHLEVLQKTSGASAVLPKTITRVLNSQACHGAIKFGDELSRHECLSLIGQLSNCDLPFQCAHGRPSLVPLFDMKLLATKLHDDEVAEPKPRLRRLQDLR